MALCDLCETFVLFVVKRIYQQILTTKDTKRIYTKRTKK
jgi:hypothetical protein